MYRHTLTVELRVFFTRLTHWCNLGKSNYAANLLWLRGVSLRMGNVWFRGKVLQGARARGDRPLRPLAGLDIMAARGACGPLAHPLTPPASLARRVHMSYRHASAHLFIIVFLSFYSFYLCSNFEFGSFGSNTQLCGTGT